MVRKREIVIGVGCIIMFLVLMLFGIALTGVFDAAEQKLDTTSTLEPPIDVPASVPLFSKTKLLKQSVLEKTTQKNPISFTN